MPVVACVCVCANECICALVKLRIHSIHIIRNVRMGGIQDRFRLVRRVSLDLYFAHLITFQLISMNSNRTENYICVGASVCQASHIIPFRMWMFDAFRCRYRPFRKRHHHVFVPRERKRKNISHNIFHCPESECAWATLGNTSTFSIDFVAFNGAIEASMKKKIHPLNGTHSCHTISRNARAERYYHRNW